MNKKIFFFNSFFFNFFLSSFLSVLLFSSCVPINVYSPPLPPTPPPPPSHLLFTSPITIFINFIFS